MFKFAGVARNRGVYRVRFANDANRAKFLAVCGLDDIEFLELSEPMSKAQAVAELLKSDLMLRDEYAAAIESANRKYNPRPQSEVQRRTRRRVKLAGVSVEVSTPVVPEPVALEPTNWFEREFLPEMRAALASQKA